MAALHHGSAYLPTNRLTHAPAQRQSATWAPTHFCLPSLRGVYWRGMLSASGAAVPATEPAELAAADAFLAAHASLPHVVVGDRPKLRQKLAAMMAGGVERLHIVSDFDMTLTQYRCPDSGERNMTSHAVVASSSITPQTLKDRTDELYKQYYPIEVSPTLTPAQKFAHMEEWWHKVHQVIVDSGLSRGDIVQMVTDARVHWRPGFGRLVQLCEDAAVPVLVFSAGLADVILEVLRAGGVLTPNMHVISNKMVFDAAPPHRCVGFEPPVIHVFNKNEGALAAAHVEYFGDVAHRRNVLLLGDSLGDLRMVEGLEHDVQLTVGFCNHDVPDHLPSYAAAFDVVITDDAPLDLVNALVEAIGAAGTAAGAAAAAAAGE